MQDLNKYINDHFPYSYLVMTMFTLSTSTKVGIYLVGLGLFFTALGCVLFFDKGLLAIGHFGFLMGSITLVGNTKTLRWMIQMSKLPATFLFVSGMVLVLTGWGFSGIVIESIGFFFLFGDFSYVLSFFLQSIK